MRSISLNAQYILLFKNPREVPVVNSFISPCSSTPSPQVALCTRSIRRCHEASICMAIFCWTWEVSKTTIYAEDEHLSRRAKVMRMLPWTSLCFAAGLRHPCPGATEQHGQIPNKIDRLQGVHHCTTLQRRDVREGGFWSASHTTRLVVGLVSNAAFNGSMTLNPFNFKHYRHRFRGSPRDVAMVTN